MPATGRRLDKYAQRRRAELAALRRAGHPAASRRPKPAPKPKPEVSQHCTYARALLPVFGRLRPVQTLQKPRAIRTQWTHAQDLALLQAFAAGLTSSQVTARIKPVRPCATPGACERHIRLLWVMYGMEAA